MMYKIVNKSICRIHSMPVRAEKVKENDIKWLEDFLSDKKGKETIKVSPIYLMYKLKRTYYLVMFYSHYLDNSI